MDLVPDRNSATQRESIPALVARLRHVGIDKATALAMAGNAASLVLGPITALVVAAKLTPELQGYYYTFGSLSVIQLLAEFGLGQALLQFASHQWSRLHMDPRGELLGDPDAQRYLAALGRIALRWCAALAIGLLPALILAGEYLFGSHGGRVSWRPSWLVVVFGLTANLFLAPVWALLQGCHQMEGFWFYRLVQQIVKGLTIWVALLGGMGLWAPAISVLAGLAWSIGFIWRRYPRFVRSLLLPVPAPLSWRQEIWPLQWRTAITWMGANFTSYLFAPILFRAAGPEQAGRMGMTVTLGTVITAFASNVVVTKGPVFGTLVAQGRFADLDAMFRRQIAVVLAIALAGSVTMVGAIAFMRYIHVPLGERVLPPSAAAMLMAYATATALVVSIGTYLRAHKHDPLGPLNVVGTPVILIGSTLLAGTLGALGVATVAAFVAACIQVPWAGAMLSREGRWRVAWAAERQSGRAEP